MGTVEPGMGRLPARVLGGFFSLDFLVRLGRRPAFSFTGLQPTVGFHPTNGRIFRNHLEDRGILKLPPRTCSDASLWQEDADDASESLGLAEGTNTPACKVSLSFSPSLERGDS